MPTGGHSTTSIPRPRPSAAARAAAEASATSRRAKGAASSRGRGAATTSDGRRGSRRSTASATASGRSGSTAPASTGASRQRATRGATRGGASRAPGASTRSGSSIRTRRSTRATGRSSDTRHDLTKAIPVEKQLVTGRRKRWVLIGAAGALFAAFAAALFVLPVKAWYRQRDDIARKQTELAALEQANAKLNEEVAALNTPEGIEEAAREEIGYVRRGEIQLTVLPLPDTSSVLPAGWPFDAAAQILTLRSTTPMSLDDPSTTGGDGAPADGSVAP